MGAGLIMRGVHAATERAKVLHAQIGLSLAALEVTVEKERGFRLEQIRLQVCLSLSLRF